MACSRAGDLWIVKPEKVDDVLRLTDAKGHHLKHYVFIQDMRSIEPMN